MTPRKQKQKHYVTTRKSHDCAYCHEMIPTGSRATYVNAFTGKRDYYHFPECPKYR